MNDSCADDVIRAVGSLEGTISQLVTQIGNHQEDLKYVRATCQRFEDYKKDREDLPARLGVLETIAQDYIKYKVEQDKNNEKVEFIWNKLMVCIAFGVVLNVLVGLMAFFFSRGWLQGNL
jgi:hypothetical protein